jgi:hypothetical protein
MRRAIKCCADTTAGKALAAPADLTADALAAAAVVVEDTDRPAKRVPKTLKQKQAKEKEEGNPYAGGSFIGSMVTSLFVCIFVAGSSGVAYIFAMRENPVCMTWFANLFFPVILFAVGMFLMGIGLVFPGVILWLFAALAVCMLFCWRTQLELAAKLLGMASQTLIENGGLIPAKVSLQAICLDQSAPECLGDLLRDCGVMTAGADVPRDRGHLAHPRLQRHRLPPGRRLGCA